MKKWLSIILSLFISCTLLPVEAFAETNPRVEALKEQYGKSLEQRGDFWVVHSTDSYLMPGKDCVSLVYYTGDKANLVIPEGIHAINLDEEGSVWKNRDQFTSITLPKSMLYMGYETFGNMKNLKRVVFQGKEKSVNGMFDCSKLSEVILPDSLQYISDLTFLRCTSLKHIKLPDSLQAIRDGAFEGSGLTEIVIPASVKLLDNPFAGCKDLTKIVVTSPDTELKDFNKYGKTYGTIYAPKGSKAESAAKKAGIPFKAIALNKTSLSLSKGKTYQLKFNSGSEAVWKSSNSKVVSVSKTGKLTATANGTATITATLYGKKYTCKVTVGAKTYTVKRGDTLWAIASKKLGSGYRYPEIMKLNGLKSTMILVGQTLELPER